MRSRLASRRIVSFAAALAIEAVALGSVTLSVDVLDGSDPGAPSPPGILIVDVHVDVSGDDWFYSAGVFGRTFHGASLVYRSNPDPNFPGPVFLPPGLENRYVSFGSAAYDRDAPARFAPGGTVAEQTVFILGRYLGGPVPTLRPDHINVGYLAVPLPQSNNDPDAPRGRDGFVMRLAFDTSAVSIPGSDEPANYRIFTPGQEPPGYLAVFVSDPLELPDPGTAVNSWFGTDPVGRDWGLYIPEPPSVVSLGVLVAFAFRRSRHSTSRM